LNYERKPGKKSHIRAAQPKLDCVHDTVNVFRETKRSVKTQQALRNDLAEIRN